MKTARSATRPRSRFTTGSTVALRIRRTALWSGVLLFAATYVSAQTHWTAPGTGLFTVAGNWDNGVPTSTLNAFITNGTGVKPTVVNLNGATGNVLDLTIATNNTLNVNLNSSFNTSGSSILNNGAINVIAGSGTNTFFTINTNTTLTGTGTLSLSYGDHNGIAFLNGSSTLTNATNTIQGDGSMGVSLANNSGGTVNANIAGQTLTVSGASTTNTGLLKATNGGILQISSNVANAGGNLTANGGTVNVSSAITGGTLNTVGTGVLQTSGQASLTNVTLSSGSTYTSGLNTNTGISGTITNHGDLKVVAGSGTNTFLQLNSATTLQGGGTVTLNSGDNNGNAYIYAPGSTTLTNVDNQIRGYGIIGNGALAVVNQSAGVINANVNGKLLAINGSGNVTNAGLVEATNGGTLQVTNIVTNSGANITANGGSIFFDNSAKVVGGTLNTSNGGTMGTENAATLDGATLGAITISAGSTWTNNRGAATNIEGTLNNVGHIQMNAGSGNNSFLSLLASTTLQGGGSVTLNNGDNNGRPFVQGNGFTLTNVNNTIQGAGTIGNGTLAFVNQAAGVVNANISGQVMLLNGSGNIANAGLLEATNGGTLQIINQVTNSGAHITANGGAVLIDNNATIRGGTLQTLSGGTMGTDNAATLDGLTAGAITLASGSTWTNNKGASTNIEGTLNNLGHIQVNAGSGNNAFLNLIANTTLQGGGSVTLDNGDNNGRPFVQGTGFTLTNVNNTIQGAGTIGNGTLNFVNQAAGVVNANISGQVMVVNASGTTGTTNSGLIEATNGGVIQLNGNLVNNQNGTIAGTAGTVDVSTVIQGGTLKGTNLQTISTATLDGGTHGALTFSTGSNYTGGLGTNTSLAGTIINQGNIQVNGGSGNNTFLSIASNTTLKGGGTITLNSGDNNGQSFIVGTGATSLTNVDNTIQGSGVIGNGNLPFINSAQGTVLANKAGNTLTINSGAAVTNNGTFAVNPGSTLHVASANFTNYAANTLTGGTYSVKGDALNTGTMQIDALGTNVGGEIVNNAAAIVLNGPNANTRLVDAGGNNALTPLAHNLAGGSITVAGGYNFTTAGNLTNAGLVHVGNGGVFNASNGISGSTGSAQIDAGGTLSVAAGSTASTTGTLTQNGTLALGSHNITVSTAYSNANFGTGNSFNNHAGVTGTGKILAAPNTALTITGSSVTGGTTTTPTLANFGNVHVGSSVTLNYSLTNAGATGPSVLGAIQTSVNGGNITDSRLTGTGATASNFGPIASGKSSSPFAVTFKATSAGALAAGQKLHFATNFDNIASPTLTLGSGAAYNLAAARLGTINFGKVLVGSTAAQFLSVANTAAATGFSEGLNATLGTISGKGAGQLSGSGAISNLGAGATNTNALKVSLNTSTAGTISASVLVNLASNGATTSGLGITALPSKSITAVGTVGNLASASAATPNPVNLGNVRVGTASPKHALTLSNALVGPGEGLNASISTASAGLTASGSIASLQGGHTDITRLVVGMNTASAGSKNGTATIALASDGSFNNGVKTTLTSQNVAVTGAVYQAAKASTLPASINLGTVRSGTVSNIGLTIANVAPATGGFTETLGSNFGPIGAGLSGQGSITGLAQGASSTAMGLTFTAGSVGKYSGNAAVNFNSQAINNSGLGTLALKAQSVSISASVQAIAALALSNNGSFSFHLTGANKGLLDFGTLAHNGGAFSDAISLLNKVSGPADSLLGSIDISSLSGSPFSFTGGKTFNLGAMGSSKLQIGFNTNTTAGLYTENLIFTDASHNAFQKDLSLPIFTLELQGRIQGAAFAAMNTHFAPMAPMSPVPEPSTYGAIGALLMAGLASIRVWSRRTKHLGC